ncbi:hypothetical protein E0Z10_g6185 [Xylaria hypoxylon]|uniref:Uncharacterized protein n=1 Tax=Xylaria hypoxylon TaxID=37992 RepID=A0A4Z0YTX7_9PEZI|nr:hypothetical protein E0Z10_g6185 [Xylaria hypoxylon]
MSSTNKAGKLVGRVNLSNWGCQIEVQAFEFAEENRVELRHAIRHDSNESMCKCRRNPDPAQESKNDEVLLNHVYNLEYVNGSMMANIFASLKVRLATEMHHNLQWNEEKKVWVTPQQQ